MIKKILISLLTFIIVISRMEGIPVLANSDYDSMIEDYSFDNGMFTSFDMDGNVYFTPYDELDVLSVEEVNSMDVLDYDVIKIVDGQEEVLVDSIDKVGALELYEDLLNQPALITQDGLISYELEVSPTSSDPEYGVVIFSGSSTLSYTNAETGYQGYLHPQSAPDAAYLGLENGKIKFKQSGVIGLISSSSYVSVVDYDSYSKSNITSTYECSNGIIYHYITTNTTTNATFNRVGYQQSYMENLVKYFSYDGHYFYKSYKTMISDYKNGVYTSAINPTDKYYNYFQYLSHRTNSNMTGSMIKTYLNSKSSVTTSSKLYNLGESFVTVQDKYGVNAALMMGVAINESSWGNSNIASTKNNLFGHGAVDSNPYYGANGYDSAYDSIVFHAEYFVSQWYLNQNDYRYFGGHLGDKQSGMNVKYASDPYWGEKAAAHCYVMEAYFSSQTYDFDMEMVGITSGNVYLYQEANTTTPLVSTGNYISSSSSKVLKDYDTIDVPLLILESVSGEAINGNSTWYKVRTDTSLNSARTTTYSANLYSFSRDYAYVHSSFIKIISCSESNSTGVSGDVNQDGIVSAVDYVLIRNHIMGVSYLTGTWLNVADVNSDGTITAVDYVLIRNHIMGVSTLQ